MCVRITPGAPKIGDILHMGKRNTPEQAKLAKIKRKKFLLKYQREWIAKRRNDYFKDKYCVKCGSVEKLELDHIDYNNKTTHRIWSWSEERRLKEIEKCQVLCHNCHREKTIEEHKIRKKGIPNYRDRKFSAEQIREMRELLKTHTQTEVMKILNVGKNIVYDIKHNKSYKDII